MLSGDGAPCEDRPAGAVHLTPKAMDVLVCLAERIDLHLALGGSFEQ